MAEMSNWSTEEEEVEQLTKRRHTGGGRNNEERNEVKGKRSIDVPGFGSGGRDGDNRYSEAGARMKR